jgi:hypothetical protein
MMSGTFSRAFFTVFTRNRGFLVGIIGGTVLISALSSFVAKKLKRKRESFSPAEAQAA